LATGSDVVTAVEVMEAEMELIAAELVTVAEAEMMATEEAEGATEVEAGLKL
jgi:hypothetical protein